MRLTENLSSRAKRLTGFLMVLTLLGFAAMPFLPAPSSLASSGKGLINKVFSTSRQEKSVPQEEKQKELTNEEKNALIEAEQKKSQESGDFSKAGVFAPHVPVAPSNDMCSGAVVIPASGPFPHVTPLINVFSATSTNDAVRTCGIGTGGIGSDFLGVWFRFTPTTTGMYRLMTQSVGDTGTSQLPNSFFAPAPTFSSLSPSSSTSFPVDTSLAVFTAASCAGPFTQLTCTDDGAGGGQSLLSSLSLTAGTDYYILVYRRDNPGPGGTGVVALQPPTNGVQLFVSTNTPPNDTCGTAGSTAEVLTLGTIVPGTLQGATNDYSVASADTGWTTTSTAGNNAGNLPTTAPGRDTVYTFTAPSAGRYTFELTNATHLATTIPNAMIYLSTTCPAAGAPATVTILAAGNRSTTNETISCVSLTAGQQVFLFVDDTGSTLQNSYFLQVTQCSNFENEATTGINETPATAIPLTCGVEGQMGTSGDIDFYSVSAATANSRLFAIVNGAYSSSTGEFDLRITNTTDTLQSDTDDNTNQFGGSSPNLAGVTVPSGTSFLRINTSNAAPYEIFHVVQPPSAMATTETASTNDFFDDAAVQTGGYFFGALSTVADADVYKFTATAGDTIFVSVDPNPDRLDTSSTFNPAIDLIDTNGNLLDRANDTNATSSNASGAGNLASAVPNSTSEALIFVARYTGTYYVRVFTTATSFPTNTAPAPIPLVADYLLSVALNCTPISAGPGSTTVTSINRQSGTNPVCGTPASVTYRVTFSAPVSGVTNSNFTLTDVSSNLTGESITSTTAVGAAPTATWDVVVSTGTASGANGMLRLDMANSTGVTPSVTNVPFTTGQTFTVNATPTADAGPASYGTVCTGSIVNLTATAPPVGTGTWSVQSGPNTSAAQFSNVNLATSTFTPTLAGSYTLLWTVANSPCTSATDTATLTVNAAPTADAGPASYGPTCVSTAVTLAATVPSVGSGSWSVQSGPNTSAAQFSNVNSATSSFTPTLAGSYVLLWTVTNAPCTAATDTATLSVSATPTADAGPASYGTVCTGAAVNLTATTPPVGTGTWSVQSGPNTSSAQFSNTASPTSTFTPTAAGSYTLLWTVANSPCTSATDTATLTVNAGPTASNAGPDQTVCQTTTAVTLAANVPSSGSGTWSVISGPNTSSAQFANTAVANTTFTPVTRPGTYTLQWSIAPSGGGCPASTDTVVITFVASPTTANAGPDQTLCITSAPATLAANTPTFGSGTWSVVSGPSTSSAQFANVNSPTTTFTPTGSVAGVYTLQWTIANSPCPSSSDTVVITFTATPTTANAGPDQSVCNDGSAVQLAANTPTVGSGSWTVVSGPSTSTTQFASTTNPTTTFTPAGGAGDYVLQWTITNAPCPASSDTVTISVTSCLELPFLFVADTNNNRIQKYDGTTWTVLGTDVLNGIDGFKNPEAVAAGDGGNLVFVADTGNNRILRSDDGGLTWTVIATTGSTINPAAVKTPAGVAVDAAGNLYVSDTGNQRVFRLDGGVAGPAIILAASGTGAGRVSAPQGLAITTANTLFVADSANSRILSIANADVAAANTGTTFASSGSGLAQVRNPQGVGVNAAGDLGVADTGNNRVLLFPGAVPGPATVLTTSGVSLGQTRLPEGITFCFFTTGALAGDTSVIVGDSANNRIEGRILAAGAWQLVTGNPAPPQTATVGSSIGQFRAPSKIR